VVLGIVLVHSLITADPRYGVLAVELDCGAEAEDSGMGVEALPMAALGGARPFMAPDLVEGCELGFKFFQ